MGSYTPDQSGPRNNGNEGVLHRTPELEPFNQMQFSIIPRTTFWEVVRSYTSAGYTEYSDPY